MHEVVELHTLHVVNVLIAGSEPVDQLRCQVIGLLKLIAEEQQLHVAHLVLCKVVGILNVLTVLLGSLSTQVVGIVLLGEFTLNKSRVGHLGLEFLKTLDSDRGNNVEVGVGILHVGLDVVGILAESQFVDTGCITPVLLVGLGVGLKDITVGIFGTPFASVLDALINILGIGSGIDIIVSACNLYFEFGILLDEFASLLKECLSLATVAKCNCSLAHVVVGVVCIGSDTLLEVGSSLADLTLVQSNLTQIVEGFGFVGPGIVEVAFKQFLSVVKTVYLVVLNTVLVTLCVGYERCTHQDE